MSRREAILNVLLQNKTCYQFLPLLRRRACDVMASAHSSLFLSAFTPTSIWVTLFASADGELSAYSMKLAFVNCRLVSVVALCQQ